MKVTLNNLLQNVINDNISIVVLETLTGTAIGRYNGKGRIPDEIMDCNVTDIFVNHKELCIEIDIDSDN